MGGKQGKGSRRIASITSSIRGEETAAGGALIPYKDSRRSGLGEGAQWAKGKALRGEGLVETSRKKS